MSLIQQILDLVTNDYSMTGFQVRFDPPAEPTTPGEPGEIAGLQVGITYGLKSITGPEIESRAVILTANIEPETPAEPAAP